MYKYLKKQKNQGVYIIKFFNAAGCNSFVLPKKTSQQQTKCLENERHFAKDRSVQLIKDKFPNPIDYDGLKQYLLDEIKDENVRDCMNHFGIAATAIEDKNCLVGALAMQFQLFLDADTDDIDNNIPSEYERLVGGAENSVHIRRSALYNGDAFWVENTGKVNAVECYGTYTHTWIIHNCGNVIWHGRKLVLKNADKIYPKVSDNEIAIPDVNPNGYKKITTVFEARSIEGIYESEWEMQDSGGNACFTANKDFNVTIKVFYKVDMEE